MFGPKSPEWFWRFRIQKARILVLKSSPKEALNLLEEEVPPAVASPELLVSKNIVEGMAYRASQDFDRSAAKYAIAENLASQSQMPMMCEVLNRRGSLKFDQKKYAEAEADFHHALDLSKQFNRRDQEASALASLARVATMRERYDEGIDRGQRALELSRSLGFRALAATVQGNLGWSYFQLGDFESARDEFKEAADTSQSLGLPGYGFYWQGSLAQSYQKLDDYGSAEALLKKTVEDAEKVDSTQTITENLNYLTRLYLRADQPEEAEKYNRKASEVEEGGADHFGVLETKFLAGRIAVLRHDFSLSDKLFRQVIQDQGSETFLKWEAEAGLAEMFEAEGQSKLAESEYREAIQEFEAKRSSIQRDELRLSFIARGLDSYDSYIEFLMRHGRRAEALRIAEQSRARTLEEGLKMNGKGTPRTRDEVPPQEIARNLEVTLMFYWIGARNSYLWLITPRKTDSFKLARGAQIAPLVKSYRQAVLSMHDAQDTGSAEGMKLFAMLVEPAKKLISKGSRVILLPAEGLYGLNFETLVVPDPQPHFWIEDVTLATGSSLTLLAAAEERSPTKQKSMLLVGDTVSPNADFPSLPQAGVEMQQVERYFAGSRREVLSGSEATPSAYLRSQPEQFAFLHFVTHGTASRVSPLESAVILSKEKGEGSYKLYARDIVNRHLSANLVTISACNGAGTRAFSGEGLVGLSWAFLRAGAHNVIGALWEVSDTSTPELMGKLYEGISRGQDPASALRAAKLSLLHSDSVFRKPYYWAPFQLYTGS